MAESSVPCPHCGHADEDHVRESWFDGEGVEGMSCSECPCQWMTWDWAEVVAGEAAPWGRDES